MDDTLYLGPSDVVRKRPFTHPDTSHSDLVAMRFMADRVSSLVKQPKLYAGQHHPVIFQHHESDGRSHRVVLCHPQQLLIPDPLVVFGLFGQKRPNADITPLFAWDKKLIAQFHNHPGIYSYSTLLLENGDFGNLVVFKDETAKDNWYKEPIHQQVISEVAYHYYAFVRLQIGVARNGIMNSDAIFLQRAKYYDYQPHGSVWRAIRTL